MKNNALKISALALSAALVAVFTMVVRIPTPTTGGYVSLCDAAVTFVAFSFGPWTGLLAGGLGTAFADLIGGYPQWAAISFVVHGLEGLFIGLIVRSTKDRMWRKVIALCVASVTVPIGYFSLTSIFLESWATAAVELVPNLIQGTVGSVTGLLLYMSVSAAYRNLDALRLGKATR